jgi:hypothetical protein
MGVFEALANLNLGFQNVLAIYMAKASHHKKTPALTATEHHYGQELGRGKLERLHFVN